MKNLTITILAVFLVIIPPHIYAQDTVKAVMENVAEASFSEIERRMIKKYIGEQEQNTETDQASTGKAKNSGKSMPPGLAKRDSLPPSLAAQLERNGTLPPGLAKRDLPADLEQQLPPVQEGYERSILEDMTVVLVEKATGKIADIIADAVLGNDEVDRRN
jgi:hypothetical protein